MQGFTTRRKFVMSAAAMTTILTVGTPAIRLAAAQDNDYPELALVATEYAFEMADTVAAGHTRVTMDNQGAEDHHAILFRVNDDATMEDFQDALVSGDLGTLLGVSTSHGGPSSGPGGTSSVIIDLDPGQYMVVCVVPDPKGVPHVAHGMVAPLDVTENGDRGKAPAVDTSITLIDMAFEGLPEEIEAGEHTWEVINGGDQLHEIALLRLAPGVDLGGVMDILTADENEAGEATPSNNGEAEGPPFVMVTGTAPKSLGARNYLELNLEAGQYVAICFIPDIETGMPHFLHGMIAEFTVA